MHFVLSNLLLTAVVKKRAVIKRIHYQYGGKLF